MAWGGTREAVGHKDDASSASVALLWHATGSHRELWALLPYPHPARDSLISLLCQEKSP